MCKEKTNRAKLTLAKKRVVEEEIRETIRTADNFKFRSIVEEIKKEIL